MADNSTQTGSDTIATDDVTSLNGGASTGVKVQRMKVGYGDDGSHRDVSATFPLPVNLASSQGNMTASTGSLSAAGANTPGVVSVTTGTGQVVAAVAAAGNVTFHLVTSAFVGTLIFEGSLDNGANYAPMMAIREDGTGSESSTAVSTAAAFIRTYTAGIPGFTHFRVRCSAFTSGSVAVVINPGPFLIETSPALGASSAVIGTIRQVIPGTAVSTAIAAATPVTTAAVDVSQAASVVFTFKNTVAATAWVGTLSVFFEQSDDGVSWGPLLAQSSDRSTAANPSNVAAVGASGSTTFQAACAGAVYVRARVATAPTSNGATVTITPIAHPLSPSVHVTNQSIATTTATPTLTNNTINSAASTNATSVRNTAATLFAVVASNSGAAAAFVKLYNKASAPTVGTDTPVITIPVPASGIVTVPIGAIGQRFNLGIALAITNLVADTDATNVAANQVKVMLSYL